MSDIDTQLKLTCMRALWTHVTPCLRAVSIELVDKEIHFQAEFDKYATEDDFELLAQVGSEIISDFSNYGIQEIRKVVPFPEKISPLKNLVYYRHEHNYFKE